MVKLCLEYPVFQGSKATYSRNSSILNSLWLKGKLLLSCIPLLPSMMAK